MLVSWQPTGKLKTIIPNAVLFPGAVAVTDFSANSVSVAPALTSTTASGGTMGAQAWQQLTLKVTDGNVSFAGSTLATATSTWPESTWDINLGNITGSGISTRPRGSATVETANLAGPGRGSVFNVTGGTLRAVGQAGQTNPAGAATVTLGNGGGLSSAAATAM
jgi:hypothetical protein